MGRSISERRGEQVRRFMGQFPPDLRESLARFFDERGLTSASGRYNYVLACRVFLSEVGKSPLEAGEGDFRGFLEGLRERGVKESTIETYMRSLNALLKWARPEDNPLSWWRPRVRRGRRARGERLRDEVLSPEEVKALVKAAQSPKSKAIIAVLYEGALRVGELCSLRMRDLEFTDYGFKVRVVGKTGQRTIPLVDSAPYIRAWLQVHPDPGNPNAPLFPSTRGGKVDRLPEEAVWALVARAASRAGIGKRVHPHTLRHTRLTHLATQLTEQELKTFAGWTQDSRMAAVYVHLSGRDAERAILRVYGIERAEEEERERAQPLKPEVCPSCGYVNPAEAEFCLRCGYPLSERAREEALKRKERLEELLARLLSDPKFKEALASYLGSLQG